MTQRTTTANSTLAIGGVSSPLDSFVVAESSVLRTNFCGEKPAHRQSAKRYGQGYETPERKQTDKRTTLKVESKIQWRPETI
jgi:hypothetical protein